MKKMLSIALCAAMNSFFRCFGRASSPRRTLSNKNMPIATSKEEDQPINKVKQPQIPTRLGGKNTNTDRKTRWILSSSRVFRSLVPKPPPCC